MHNEELKTHNEELKTPPPQMKRLQLLTFTTGGTTNDGGDKRNGHGKYESLVVVRVFADKVDSAGRHGADRRLNAVK